MDGASGATGGGTDRGWDTRDGGAPIIGRDCIVSLERGATRTIVGAFSSSSTDERLVARRIPEEEGGGGVGAPFLREAGAIRTTPEPMKPTSEWSPSYIEMPWTTVLAGAIGATGTGAERSRPLRPLRTTAEGFATPPITMPGVGLVLVAPTPVTITGRDAGEIDGGAAAGGVRAVTPEDRIGAGVSSGSTRLRRNEDEPDTRAESVSLPAGDDLYSEVRPEIELFREASRSESFSSI